MNKKNVDLLIIGAGANGSTTAYEAVKRGLKVALIDSGDVGHGTSSRSTKLLHGGVRYLELAFKTGDISQLKLVQEALSERAYWLKKTPFLAKQLELALPCVNCFGSGYYRIGLGLYDLLSGKDQIKKSRLLSNTQIHDLIPRLNGNFNGGVAYSDGQFNDARLNLLLALTAKKAGAILRTHSKVIELTKQTNGRLTGAISENIYGEKEHWEAKVIVNATGIQADQLRQSAEPNASQRIITSRGIHIVLQEKLCPKGIGILLPKTNDNRVLFVLPFFGRTLVGTTDTPCAINDSQIPSEQEQNYLINHLQALFPNLHKPSIISSWAGGRPLLKPKEQEKESTDSSRVVREHEIEILECGLISAMGGKWTTCRPIALDTLKAIETVLGSSLPKEKQIPLIGCEKDSRKTNSLLSQHKSQLKKDLQDSPLQTMQIDHLQSSYGVDALSIIQSSNISDREPLSDVIPICKAEIHHWMINEHAKTTTDMMARRCRLAMVDINEAKRLIPTIQSELARKYQDLGGLDLTV